MVINVRDKDHEITKMLHFVAYVETFECCILTHSPLGSREPTTNVIKSPLTILVSHQLPRSHISHCNYHKYNYTMY